MRLLMEGHSAPHPLRRGEYRHEPPYIAVACPSCERISLIHKRSFAGEFTCNACGERDQVKLTGERA